MMDCAAFRRSVLANPHADDPGLRGHAAGCTDCAGYAQEVLEFEGRLDRALRVRLEARPAGLKARPLGSGARRWFAAAASVVLGLGVAGGVWFAGSRSSLAADVVEHMAGEPAAWAVTNAPVDRSALDQVLRESNVQLDGNPGLVTYARSCRFRGHEVPHLVVQTDAGPVTVLVLIHEATRQPQRFDESGYRGMLLPVEHGSIAVLERDGTQPAAVDSVLARIRAALRWTGQTGSSGY